MKKKLMSMLFLLIALFMISGSAQAARTRILRDEELYYSRERIDHHIKLKKNKYVLIYLKVKTKSNNTTGKIEAQLFKGGKALPKKRMLKDYWTFKKTKANKEYELWVAYNKKVKPGTYTCRIRNSTNKGVSITTKIFTYDQVASQMSMSSNASVIKGNWKKVGKFPKDRIPLREDIECDDYNVVSSIDITIDGSLWVYANETGQANVTVTLLNGKQYSCNVNVGAGNPNLFAQITEYNTRDNYFLLRLKNNGLAAITILSSGAYSEDKDYRSYDRNLYSSGDVTLSPGQSANIRFYVNGSHTWPNVSHHTIFYRCIYDGKEWLYRAGRYSSAWYKDNTWWNTYWTSYETKYNQWKQ